MAASTSYAASTAAQGFHAFTSRPDATVSFKGIDTKAKARAAAEDFEAVFLNSMFSQMFTGIDGEGPFGGDQVDRRVAFVPDRRIRQVLRQERRHRDRR